MRTILITGCSSGIGKSCADNLLREGWDVHATARNTDDIEVLQEMGVKAYYLDYCEFDSIHRTFDAVIENTGGKLDALFNNGAYGQPGAVEDLTTDVLRAQFEANFFGWHELTNLCVPIMRKQGHGRIVHCSSVLGWIAAPYRGAYNASKFALEGLVSTMRLELRDTDIHVSLIEPGPIKTRFSENALQNFLENVDWENSVNKPAYEKELLRLKKQKSNSVGKFTLPPESVYKKLDHALNAKKPKAHYPVTVPTHFMNIVRRVLPQSMVDSIILKNT
ncbi:MAG: SDR family oxidoreductase [Pseudomonadota bacterium]